MIKLNCQLGKFSLKSKERFRKVQAVGPDTYKTLIKRLIFDYSDETEIWLTLSLQIFLNVLQYIWWLLKSIFFDDGKDVTENNAKSFVFVPDMETIIATTPRYSYKF